VTKGVIEVYRRIWPQLDVYGRRKVVEAIELRLAMLKYEDPSKMSEEDQADWTAFMEEMRPPKAPFTLDYRCSKCKGGERKLWRGVHGCADENGHELLCAVCLAPNKTIRDDGRFDDGVHGLSDQVNGWLPAVPVDDTYWGYTSVPTADCRWWEALPTYPSDFR